ncbi:hypothetical protein LSO9J_100033 [Candidatus Liberibacter solanacearum]
MRIIILIKRYSVISKLFFFESFSIVMIFWKSHLPSSASSSINYLQCKISRICQRPYKHF